MLGAIAGDIIGSVFEGQDFHDGSWVKLAKFPLFSPHCRFTDDTVQTIALADAILHNADYTGKLHEYFDRYPQAGYGGKFIRWAKEKQREPYHSFGNGSAMRVSPVGFAYDTLDDVLTAARDSANVTHNHPEGIKGAQAVASAIFLARTQASKDEIRNYIARTCGYDLDTSLSRIRLHYEFDATCRGSVPQSIRAFLESHDYESAVRNAVSLGGDTDTMGCIAGGIAQAFYGGVPAPIAEQALAHLNNHLLDILHRFCERYNCRW